MTPRKIATKRARVLSTARLRSATLRWVSRRADIAVRALSRASAMMARSAWVSACVQSAGAPSATQPLT